MVKSTAVMLKQFCFMQNTRPRRYLRANATSNFDRHLKSTLSNIDYAMELLGFH